MMLRTDTAAPKAIYLKDYQPFPYTVEQVDLTVKIFEGKTLVTSTIEYSLAATGTPELFLFGAAQKVHGIYLNGEKLASDQYRLSDKGFTMPFPGARFTLTFETEISPETNTSLEGLYKSGDSYCTQCESEGFRKITYYPDRPDVLSTFKVRLEGDAAACPVLLSNGNLIESGALEDGRHYAVWHDPFPKPCYLFALVAGKLVHIEDFFTTKSGRKVALRIYTRDGDLDQAQFGMEALIQSMKWDEDAYGREYDLDIFNIVAVSDFNFGAMENKSLNVFNTARILARPDITTDREYIDIRRVVGHEYFHNWSGNRVTCRDWFQLSLKEGFTVFRENQFGQAVFDPEVERIDEVKFLREMQFPEDAGPMAHPIRPDNYIEITNFYTATVYEKGGEVIRMLSTLLGAGKYREATDLYFERHDGHAATCDDFVKCMADVSGIDLAQFMLWYTQSGTPTLEATGDYDAANKRFTLTLKQTLPPTPGQPHKRAQHIPVSAGLVGPNGQDMDAKVLQLTQPEQQFVFENIGSRPVPSILRGFSAPVILKTDLSEDDLRFLMVHDSDGFNRWEAGQTLALRLIGLHMRGDESAAAAEQAFIEALSGMIDSLRDKKRALLAHMLTLPEEAVISQFHHPIDPELIYNVRQGLIGRIGKALMAKLESVYKDNAPLSATFSLEPEAVARRALRNRALDYIVTADLDRGKAYAASQYQNAVTMTERLGAMQVLADHDIPERAAMLDDFFPRFEPYELAINKWFSVQAAAVRSDVVANVQALMAHPAFTFKNPNRLRSLLGTFAMRNMPGFHAADGSGYRLLADAIIKVNAINPQVAARLVTPMRQWRQFKPALAAKMKDELTRILNTKDLSPDVFEVVSKTLAD